METMNLFSKNHQSSGKGISSISLNSNHNRLLVNSMDNIMMVYNMNSIDFQKPKEFNGHKTSYFVKSVMSPCSNYILSGSIDKNMYIWKNNVISIFFMMFIQKLE